MIVEVMDRFFIWDCMNFTRQHPRLDDVARSRRTAWGTAPLSVFSRELLHEKLSTLVATKLWNPHQILPIEGSAITLLA